MAEFRSDIYFQQQQPDVLGSVERGLKMSDLIQERQNKRLEQEQNSLIDQALSRNTVIDEAGNAKVNTGALLSQLSGKVPSQKLMQVQQQLLGQQKLQAETQNLQADQLKKMIDNGLPLLQATKQNPGLWGEARNRLVQLGFKDQDLPEQADQQWIDQYIMLGEDASKELDRRYKEAQLAQTKAQTGKIYAETNEIGKKKDVDVSKAATELRKERSGLPTTKETSIVSTSYNTMKSIANDATGASDMSLIFSYMKMLDPASTVREGEYASAKNTAGIPERILNSYNKAIDGQFLSPQQRKDFLSQAKKKYDVQISAQKQIDKKFESLAKKAGADPQDVIFDVEASYDDWEVK